ncbi:TIM barrel protein [Amycolatopsis sp. CA-161197]|uniref:TIM barrel protein n=1 Tax=Amycolatopsis sp. CA-161197 TaxID=3239922 RepID=UPI003D8C5898
MNRIRYAFSLVAYGDEPVETGLERIARYGYDAVELIGESEKYDLAGVRLRCADLGLDVSAICSMWIGNGRDLSSADPAERRSAVAYGHAVTDMAATVGAPTVVVCPARLWRVTPSGPTHDERAWAVDGIRQVAEYAGERGVQVTIEPWNRYETHLVNTVADAAGFAREVGLSNVGVLPDTFHMNIEETGQLSERIEEHSSFVNHVHFSDSNRGAPGTGHIDFAPIVRTLLEIGYDGYVTFELLPPAADPSQFATKDPHRRFRDPYTRTSIAYLKDIVDDLTQ